jgi:integrase
MISACQTLILGESAHAAVPHRPGNLGRGPHQLATGWIRADPTAGLRHKQPAAATAPLRAAQVSALFALPVSLREHAFWRLLHDSGAPTGEVLALDANRIDLSGRRVRPNAGSGSGAGDGIEWQETTSQALRWLLAGRARAGLCISFARRNDHADDRDRAFPSPHRQSSSSRSRSAVSWRNAMGGGPSRRSLMSDAAASGERTEVSTSRS